MKCLKQNIIYMKCPWILMLNTDKFTLVSFFLQILDGINFMLVILTLTSHTILIFFLCSRNKNHDSSHLCVSGR